MDINKKIKIFKKLPLTVTLKQIFIALTVVVALVTAFSVFQAALRFVKVGEIRVVGIDSNPYEDVIEVRRTTGIKGSDYWYEIDTDEVEKLIMEKHQYFSSVKVKRSFPNKIVIKVENRLPEWYVDIGGTKYTLDEGLYVISEEKNTDGITKLSLPNLSEAFYRELPILGQSEVEVRETLKIINAVCESPLRYRVTELNAENRTNIFLEIDGIYKANLGTTEEITEKLSMIEKMLQSETVKNSNGGTFDATTYQVTEYVSFNPN